MTNLTVLKFETADGADQAMELAVKLREQYMLELFDAATVSWPLGAKKPKTRQLNPVTGAAALDGAFWGTLFGLIFFMPFLGMVTGAALGALASQFADYGIGDQFLKTARDQITVGTSALFLLTGAATTDKVLAAFKTLPKFELISSNLSAEQEAQLRAAFGQE